ncbi:MAG: bifunctional riboflavin kinase/FAD synthetase [Oscillospiraceae bacterium]|nr:bifunctional riboflavin kinase/FAD synthetase [Oscillospiraceae bacterium]
MKEKSIYALGFFDGVHLGHQALLRECRRLARELNRKPCAITFQQHPMAAFVADPPKLISTVADRENLLRRYGMEEILCLPVTKDVMSTNWQDFLLGLIEKGASGFVCGDDFRFGSRGEGNAEKLQAFCAERGFPCVIVPEQLVDGKRISSTHIRTLLEQGDMATAVKFLGHPYVLTGTVQKGASLGRTLGTPTANLAFSDAQVVPKFGVYACKISTDLGEFLAVTNVGTRPTVQGQGITVEPWILDFDGDLYGKTVELSFYRFLRPEQKFDSLEALRAEIRKNAAQTRDFFAKT